MNESDAEFEVPQDNKSFTSNSSSRLLRSTCHHLGPCHEGNGIQFNSRISPSPSRSSLYKRRRQRHKSGTTSFLESTEEEIEERPNARRDLSQDFQDLARVEGWVADSAKFSTPVETRTLRLNTSSRRVNYEKMETFSERRETYSERKEEKVVYNEYQPFEMKTPSKMTDTSFSTTSSGSPRLRAFDGNTWKHSPRTGYTYTQSASYRNQWTPDREIPMPHMARRPLYDYDDGEVSFHLTETITKRSFVQIFLQIAAFVTQKLFVENLHFVLWELPTIILPLLVPSHLSNLASEAEANFEYEDQDEIEVVKKTTYILHDFYYKNNSTTADFEFSGEISWINKLFYKFKRYLVKSTKLTLNLPKTLVLLLVPSILSKSATAQNVNGVSFRDSNNHLNPPLIIEETGQIGRFQEIWTRIELSIPEVFNSAIASLSAIVSAIFLVLNPKFWIKKLPKISKRRIRKWRRNRKATRFSARIRKLPVQFTGELPVTKRKRRPKTIIEEPKETRIQRIMAEFEKKVAKFQPSLFMQQVSKVVEKFGYFQEEEIELRRSARLRGLEPEYLGLAEKSTGRKSTPRKRPIYTESELLSMNLEELMKPVSRSLVASIFAYFGFFSEAEIQRRRSLRLQGLDPEYEGLTWGPRKRPKKSRMWSIFGDYHEDDEVFFEYHDEEEGFFQRILDKFLHIVGYLHFEDIHDESLEESDDEEEDFVHGYVEIPSESFVQSQNQHEASFENSYNFEATEGILPENIKNQNSCLGIILVLAIPLLLLLSLVIYDSNFNGAQELFYLTTSGLFSTFNSVFVGFLTFTNWLVVKFFAVLSLVSSTLIISQDVSKPAEVDNKVNYDNLALNLMQNDKFIEILKENLKENNGQMEDKLTQLIQDNFNVLVKDLEEDGKNLKVPDFKDANIQDNKKEIEEALENFKVKLTEAKENDSLSVLELKERLKNAEAELEKLMILVQKCCNKNADIIPKDILENFFQAQKSQFVTRQEFDLEMSKILTLIQDKILQIQQSNLDRQILNHSTNFTMHQDDSSDLSQTDIQNLVDSALLKYGADKTGAFDFALETAGGSVVSTRCTQMYTARLPQYSWFGIPLWLPLPVWGPATNPRTAIQPGVMPGECWAFQGSEGFLVIKLAMPMKPTRFSLEHIPKSLSPNGKIDSAPKDFLVLGLQGERDENAIVLGTFTYDDDGEPLQFFEVSDNVNLEAFSHVELRILNNHGNQDYTCLYRFRVHGSL